jgi:hypothetical protein
MAVTCVLICQAVILTKPVYIVTCVTGISLYCFMFVSLWCSLLCSGAYLSETLDKTAIVRA